MTTRERREYASSSSSNVVRTLHPSRPLSPVKVDHNLDHLLDDLQHSVERTKSKDLNYLLPSVNTSTVVRERSVSPGGAESRRVYKTAHYEYSSGNNVNNNASQPIAAIGKDVQQNINSLDSLLLDLKHERERSLERAGEINYPNVGIDDGLLEPPASHVSRTTKTYTTSGGPIPQQHQHSSTTSTTSTVNRELNFDSPPTLVSRTTNVRQSRSRQRSPIGYDRNNIETHVTRDVSYDSDPNNSNTTTINRSYNTTNNNTYSSSTGSRSNHHQVVVPYGGSGNEFVVDETDVAGTLPRELSGLPLASGILPGPGTKVTTTIKTFTYEIPGDSVQPTPSNQSFHYKNDTYNTNTSSHQQHLYPLAPAERDIPSPTPGGGSTTIYRNETYNTINRTNNVGPDRPRSVSPTYGVEPSPIINKSTLIKRETHNTTSTTSNAFPGGHQPQQPQQPPPHTTTYMYKQDVRNTTNTTNTQLPPPQQQPPPTHLVYEPSPVPVPVGPKQTYMYKREVTNTKNTVYGPPGGGDTGPRLRRSVSPQPLVEYPPHGQQPPQPAGPTTVMYNVYSTNSHTSTRNLHGLPPTDDSRQPLLPFPVDDGPHGPSQVDGVPPKRLDDLLSTFGDTNGHGPQHQGGIDEPFTPRKEIQTALTSSKAQPIIEPNRTTKPIAGPPVYYPPGKEQWAKSEQSEAAWRAQGGYANARAAYEYESGSKSKSSSKSGAAVVPVCLPLCCAMPCSIM